MNENKSSEKVIILVIGWILFAILSTVFFIFFYEDLPFVAKDKNGEIADKNNQITTNYIYDTNTNLDINILVSSYLDALVGCKQEELKGYVLEPSVFDNMAPYQEKAKYIQAYENINCYTVDGYEENTTIVYVISNLNIKEVLSKPLDIQTLYVRNIDGNYLVDNRAKDDATIQYIAEKTENKDIQGLYKAVQDNINHCLETDETFKDFYNTINIK